jgi:type VI secretion system protein ImpC
MKAPHIPFKILALAPFVGQDCPVWEKAPVRVDPKDLDQAIGDIKPSCNISLPHNLCSDESIELKFTKLKDFHPDSLVQNNHALQNLWEAKVWVEEAVKKNLASQEINANLEQWSNLPPVRVEIASQKPPTISRNSVDKILDMVALPNEQSKYSSESQDATQQIETILKQILELIFSDETFRMLDSSWRGLNLLMRQKNLRNSDFKIEIVPVSFDSLDETLAALTAEIIDELPSLILVSLDFDNSPRSLGLLERIGQFAETLMVPAITCIRPSFFHIESWQDIKKLAFLPHYLEESPYARWQSLKRALSSGWLAVTCNRFLLRYQYGKDSKPRSIPFEEQKPLWINPVWALGSLICQSFVDTGWPTRFTDWQQIHIEDLPLNTKDQDTPLPTEASFDRDRIDQFIRSGIIPLAASQGKDIAFVPDEITVGDTSLRFQLLLSRITQLVLWCRDHFEKGLKGADLEEELRKAFYSFWEKSGHSGPESLEISAGHPDQEDIIPVRIMVKPSRDILPSRKQVELNFRW